ncbi:MAG: HNH endonuclease [Legionellales bacterium]|nr:HNH endonuclease [Legionellales bacterium]|tara:strand:- start:7577 stop:8203 length:627 start_codon:yes stop_codon:yes gene_type:complete
MHSITLNASLYNYSLFRQRKANPAFRKLAKQIWQRDDYTCQFCEFQARQFQEIVNLDQNYRNNKKENLATACCFCTQCFFLESVGEGGYGGGLIIYNPHMSQGEINSLCHVLFCAMINNTEYKESAQAMYRTLRMRSGIVEEKFGEGMSDPAAFGQTLLDFKMAQRKNPKKLLQNLRLLPSRTRFKKQIERWAQQAGMSSPPENTETP